MVDIQYLITKGENHRLEAKKAAGGIPDSLWESYSAFANTEGGVILLGVSEIDEKLVVTGVDDAQRKVKLIWDILNNREKISANVLMEKHVYVQQIDSKEVIVIEVPRADRHDKPVYINNDLLGGAYRRNAEGDYRCSPQSVKAMLRDQSDLPVDSTIIHELSWKNLDVETIARYRNHFSSLKPSHVWNGLDTLEFLNKTGTVKKIEAGVYCPTIAGLVLFGTEDIITQIFPDYFLDYREIQDHNRWSDRVVSNLGEWSGNIFDFFFKVNGRLSADVKRPFMMRNHLEREDDTPVHKALREALANAIIHADYYGRQGIVIEKSNTEIKIANPGSCRPDINEVKEGGVSDPRNPTIFKMFALIDIGERAGSGVYNICSVWKDMGWKEPILKEKFNPERTIVVLPIELEKRYESIQNINFVSDSSIKYSEKSADSRLRWNDRGDGDSDKKSTEKSKDCSEKSKNLAECSEKYSNSDKKCSEKSKDLAECSEKKSNSEKKSSEKISELKNSSIKSSEKIVTFIKYNPLVTIKILSGELNLTTRAIEKNLFKLKSKGVIDRIGPDKGGYWKINV